MTSYPVFMTLLLWMKFCTFCMI